MTLAEIQSLRQAARAKLEDLIGRTSSREMSTDEKQIMSDLTAEGQRLNSLASRYEALEQFDRGAAQPIIRHPLVKPADDKAAYKPALDGFFRTGIMATDTPLQIQQSPLSGAAAAVRTDVVDQVIDGVPVIDVPAQLGVTEFPRETTNPLVITALAGAPAAAVFNEGAGPTESDPGTYKTITLTGARYANLTKVSLESIMNVAFPLVSTVVRALTIGQIAKQNTDFCTALKTATAANTNCLRTNTGGTEDPHTVLSKLITGLPDLWQNNPQNQFLLNSTDLETIIDARDSQERPLLDVSAGKLMGKPYTVCDSVDRVYYGNFNMGALRSRTPLYVQVLRELYAPAFVGYSAYQFADWDFYASFTTVVKQPVIFTNLNAAGA